jgi:class 3 adenylate cyclase
MATRNLSIMFTDIKGFTQRTSASSREAMKALLAQHERLLLPVFAHFEGTVVKTIGDAFLVHFESPTDAVLCGVTIQEVLRQYNEQQSAADQLEVRVAINVGEVELTDSDVMGEAVNIAARLEGVTEAGEVWFTDAVYQTMNRAEAPSAEVGERVFKGIPHPIRVYKVIHEPDSEMARHLAKSVTLTDGEPQLAGMNPAALQNAGSNSSRCRRTVLASLTVLLLSALVVWWIPSTEEMALEKTQQLLNEGNPADALVIADKFLLAEPDSKELRGVAITAARAQLDKLVAQGDIKAAEGWLYRQLEVKPYLEPLRSEMMILDARDTINIVLSGTRYAADYHPEPLQQFVTRYADNADAPYHAAILLQGKAVTPQTRLWLMRTALERGHPADENIYHLYLASLEGGKVDHLLLESARKVLLEYYPEQSLVWAEAALEESNVMAFMNGWALLKESSSPKLDDVYYQSLYRLLNAYQSQALEQGRAVLSGQHTAARQAQVVAFLGELVESYPKFINGNELRDEISRLQVHLKREWNL